MTVNTVAAGELERFRQLCRHLSLKPIVSQPNAAGPIQPMTCSRVAGTLAAAQHQAHAIQARLEQSGFGVSRVKIETAPWNSHAPVADPRLSERSDSRYFEYCARLLVPASADALALAALCRQFEGRLARATHARRDGQSERFIILRSHSDGSETFAARVRALALALATAGYLILSSESEYCLYDSNLWLDAPWFAGEDARERAV